MRSTTSSEIFVSLKSVARSRCSLISTGVPVSGLTTQPLLGPDLGISNACRQKYPSFALSRPTTNKVGPGQIEAQRSRSEEHTSELQSQSNLVCRLLLEKK